MKLRTGLQIGALVPIIMAMMACMSLIMPARVSSEVEDMLSKIEGLATEVSELDVAAHHWLSSGNSDAEAMWRKRHEAAGLILSEIQLTEFLPQLQLDSMRESYVTTGEIFAQLIRSRTEKPEAERATLTAREQILSDTLLDQTKNMLVVCSQIARSINGNATAFQRERNLIIAAIFGIISLIMAIVVLVAGRQIMERLEIVRAGFGVSTEGDLDQAKAETSHDDEIEELHRSFNRMSGQLKDSQEILKKEALEHQTAVESLRKAHVILSDALIKLQRAQTQVVDGARLDALKQIAHGIEHSFNNNLTPILGLSDFLLTYPESLEDRTALTDHLKTINGAVKKAQEQVDRLVGFFRPAKDMRTTTMNLNELVQQHVRATRHIWLEQPREKGISIRVVSDFGDIPTVDGDQTGLCEILTSLITNSVEAMPHGGTITISTRAENNKVVLKVSDDGEGMSEEVRSRCFEPFFSTKGEGSVGMGLTVVSKLVRRHGGTIDLQSTPGHGTTVSIFLQAKADDAKTLSSALPGGNPEHKFKVLVVDDASWVRNLCSAVLKTAGHDVDTASDGPEGEQKARASHFDLVILDKAMPSMSGEDLAKHIKKFSPDTRIILLTGFGEVLIKEGILPDGVDMVLSKPVSVDVLSETVVKLMTTVKKQEKKDERV